MARKVFGRGVVDVSYPVKVKEELPRVGGKRRQKILFVCPIYSMWYEMLRRALSTRYKESNPSYKEVSVCEDWLSLTKFRSWVETTYPSIYDIDGNRMEVDKDLLTKSHSNKIYSPETCILLPKKVNRFVISARYNGELPVGVSLTSRGKRENIPAYVCRIREPLTGKETSTSFSDPLLAKSHWVKEKIKICQKLCTYYNLPPHILELIKGKVLR